MSNKVLSIERSMQRDWGWLFVLGLIFIILGCLGLSMEVGLTLVSMIFFGVLLILGGLSQLFDVFKSKEWEAAFWHALVAILYIFGGMLVVYDPFLASTLITAILAGLLIVIGISRLVMAFKLHGKAGWIWLVLAGIVGIILGLLILMQWPLSGLWVIGLFIAIQMIVDGWSYVFVALAIRRAS